MEYYVKGGEHRYCVLTQDGFQIAIDKLVMSLPNTKIIWLQVVQVSDIIQPLDLVQAISEGLEECKLNRPDL